MFDWNTFKTRRNRHEGSLAAQRDAQSTQVKVEDGIQPPVLSPSPSKTHKSKTPRRDDPDWSSGGVRRAATGESKRHPSNRHASEYSTGVAEILGYPSQRTNTKANKSHGFSPRGHKSLRAFSYQPGSLTASNEGNLSEEDDNPGYDDGPPSDPDSDPSDADRNGRSPRRPSRKSQDASRPSRTANSSIHFDTKLKMSDVPSWDGNQDTIMAWLLKINEFAVMSDSVFEDLGRIVPKRLTGEADRWYYSLPLPYRLDLEKNWATLREGISDYYLNRRWWERQKDRARQTTYRQPGFTRETPSEYYIRKADLLNTAFDLTDSEMITQVMDGAPLNWNAVVTTQLYKTAVEFQASIRFHEDQLLRLDPSYRNRSLNTYELRTSQDKQNFPYRNSHVRMIGASNQPLNPPFPRDDGNKTRRRKAPKDVGARPCRLCRSGEHWDSECKHHDEGMRTARTRLAEADVSELQAQDEYNELYYGLDVVEDFELAPQITESSCRLAIPCKIDSEDLSALGGVNCENEESVEPIIETTQGTQTFKTETSCTKFKELPSFPRRERCRLEKLQRRLKRVFHITHLSSGFQIQRPVVELKKHMERPVGCTFLGRKATTAYAGINGVGLDILKIIINSGSDITLISRKA